MRLAKKLLLIGWDGADWKVITPLLESGLMPTLNSLINEGVMGNIATLEPVLSPILWTTIATGKRGDKHGILGFTEPSSQQHGIRTVRSTSRKCKAFWNILTQTGLKCNVVGWYASHPAEPIDGVCVSNAYPRSSMNLKAPSKLIPGCIHPERVADPLKELLLRPTDLSAGHLLPFMPEAAKIDQQKDGRLARFVRMLTECINLHSATTWAMENEPWDVTAVYYGAIDQISHAFMRYHPPKMEGISERDFEIYKDVVNGIYRFHDMMLERLVQLAGPDATVMIISDHGFHSDYLRPKTTPRHPMGPAAWHREHGIICIKGPHIKKDERIYGASVLDVTPTLLAALDLPIGEDMEGRPLLQAYEEFYQPKYIPSWEKEEGGGMHPEEQREDPHESIEALNQLVALGYIDPPDPDKEKAVQNCQREQKYNLAQIHSQAGRPAEAMKILKELVSENPNEARFALHYAQNCFESKDLAECQRVLEEILNHPKAHAPANLLLGNLHLAKGNIDEALKYLQQAESFKGRMPILHCQIAQIYHHMKHWDKAEEALNKALQIDPDCAEAHDGMAATLIQQKRYEEAAESALRAVGLQHYYPRAHFHLGVALAHIGWIDRAIQAFEICLTVRPRFVRAHEWLAKLYQSKNPSKASEHQRLSFKIYPQRQQRT